MRYSAKDGSHVALTKCFYCGGDGCILLHKRLGDISEAHGKVVNMEPCSKCQDFMEKGIILITINNEKSTPGWNKGSMPDPYRTGGFFVITEDAFKRIFHGEGIQEFGLKHRFMFIEHEAAEQLGFFAHAKKEEHATGT